MLIHEACKASKLTKKAIEYYTEQGLITPAIMENGYRNFSESDVALLKKIAVLRGLGLTVTDIKNALDNPKESMLLQVSRRKEMELLELQKKRALMQKLAQDGNWESAAIQLETLEQKQSILQRLQSKFPGYYGKCVCLHFAPFLDEPITTAEQREAFLTIILYLDGITLVVPDELKDYLDEAAEGMKAIIPEVYKSRCEAIQNTEQYLADNKDMLVQYMEYIKSDEYKQSPAYSLKEFLTQFNNQSGYNDVFIPAMKVLSSSYRQYHDDLLKANDIFIKQYGDTLDF